MPGTYAPPAVELPNTSATVGTACADSSVSSWKMRPAVGRRARRPRRRDTRTAGSLIAVPGSDILFCDERAKECGRGRPGGHDDAAAAVTAARAGRAARRRRAGAVRLADRAEAAGGEGRGAGAEEDTAE